MSHCSIPMCAFGFVVEAVSRVDGPVFSFADELDDGALVVLAAVDEPLHHADDDDDEEGDDAVVWTFVVVSGWALLNWGKGKKGVGENAGETRRMGRQKH